jgi:hypothetical protein
VLHRKKQFPSAAALCADAAPAKHTMRTMFLGETVPGTGEVARFPAETLGTHKDGNTEYSVTMFLGVAMAALIGDYHTACCQQCSAIVCRSA